MKSSLRAIESLQLAADFKELVMQLYRLRYPHGLFRKWRALPFLLLLTHPVFRLIQLILGATSEQRP